MMFSHFKNLCSALLIVATAPAVASAQSPDEWTVGSFNIRYDNPDDPLTWTERAGEVTRAIAFFDVIGLQEVLPNQLEDLVSGLPWMSYYGETRNGEGMGEACPILWQKDKYDLIHAETRWFAKDWYEPSIGWDAHMPRIATIVLLYEKSSGKTIRLINAHLSHVGEKSRKLSVQLLKLWASTKQSDAVVVMGDFNAEPESEVMTSMMDGELVDTYGTNPSMRCRRKFGTYTTFDPAFVGSKRIDYIFAKGVDVIWTCADEYIKNGYYISDHLPVHAALKW